ncbi:glutathione S-transferase family protein [Pseudofulvimonas gallinarii]|jgi:putative glutathione S-transferase|uniref:Putative glutathione S-transferase n=1 Tax=Pseudofulvimonas gallinarii TaxID=634155 RepID=A0A4V3UUI4_9GAMM|nr:glutathione S-transferase family protein [Pseudofulvimonas gallinarii]TCS96191.1 putative glutathione S-transferase [Pseudofulvimonas gallinarii]THD14621.1 glutathione-dependent reductase [Pseudofulvimonas gallinarii]
MGVLVDGQWHDSWYDTAGDGRFKREDAAFRDWLSADGGPGPDGQRGHRAEAGRYRLYVSLACPWAHRTLIVRALKGLEDLLPVSVVHWRMLENGWTFEEGPGVTPDPVMGARFLHQLYTRARPGMNGRVTVPMLWDQATDSIVSNESSELIRMFNSAYDALGARPGDFCPESLRVQIDAVNGRVYDAVNNGVYRAGFATTQDAYEEAVRPLFSTLDWLDGELAQRSWLVGDRLTEADIRLFTTLVRFDAVYHGHFKCNLRRIADYPGLRAFVARMMAIPGIAATVNFDHIKRHYYESHRGINPTGIVPLGPLQPY